MDLGIVLFICVFFAETSFMDNVIMLTELSPFSMEIFMPNGVILFYLAHRLEADAPRSIMLPDL